MKRREFLAFGAALATLPVVAQAQETQPSSQGRIVVSLDELIQRVPPEALPQTDDAPLKPFLDALRGEAWAKSQLAIRDRFYVYRDTLTPGRFLSDPKSVGVRKVAFLLTADPSVRDGRYLNRLDVKPMDEVELYATNATRYKPMPAEHIIDGKPAVSIFVSDAVVQLAKISKERFEREQRLKR